MTRRSFFSLIHSGLSTFVVTVVFVPTEDEPTDAEDDIVPTDGCYQVKKSAAEAAVAQTLGLAGVYSYETTIR